MVYVFSIEYKTCDFNIGGITNSYEAYVTYISGLFNSHGMHKVYQYLLI